MYVVVEENPNCEPDERMFSESGAPRRVSAVQVNDPRGLPVWCDVVAVEAGETYRPCNAVSVEDSSDGTAWLVVGGDWGLRFRPIGSGEEWSLKSAEQWGAPFKVLDHSGSSIRFSDDD